MTTPSITLEVTKWAATAPFIANPKEGYFPFAVIADAFDKGGDHREKQLREKFVQTQLGRLNGFTEKIVKVLGLLSEQSYHPRELYLSGAQEMLQAIITVPPEEHDSDKFIDAVYALVSQLEVESQKEGIAIDISFLDHTDGIDRQLLRDEGYTFQLDLSTGKPLVA